MSTQLPRLSEHGYDVIGYLGKGSEGAVFKARYLGPQPKGTLQPDQNVAIKITPCDKVRPNEVLLQARIQHINVIRLYDVFRVEDKDGMLFLAIVMEIADPSTYRLPGSSLWNCIEATVNENMRKVVFQRDPNSSIRPPIIGGEPMIRWIFLQVASALDYLHRHPLGICNRDVKPENVLVVTFEPHADGVQRPVCKLADFGFSKALSSRESATRLGTAFYVAPEIYLLKTVNSCPFHAATWHLGDVFIDSNTKGFVLCLDQKHSLPFRAHLELLKSRQKDRSEAYNGSKADVWSAGILLYTLVSGLRPFQEREDDQETTIMLRATKERHVAALFTRLERLNASPDLVNLLRGMLRADANRRLSMLEVIQHPWSRKLNQDIHATVNVKPENGEVPTGTPDTIQQPLPCWDWLFSAAQRTIEDAQRTFAHSAAQSQGGAASPFVSHGWCLPYTYEEVSLMLDEIKAVGTEVSHTQKLVKQRSERSTSATISSTANNAVEERQPHTARPHHSPDQRTSPTCPAPSYTAPVGRTTPRSNYNNSAPS